MVTSSLYEKEGDHRACSIKRTLRGSRPRSESGGEKASLCGPTLLGCLRGGAETHDRHAEMVGATVGIGCTKKTDLGDVRIASKGKRVACFSKCFALRDPAPGTRPGRAPFRAAHRCSLRIGRNDIIDSHPYRGQAGCGCNYLSFGTATRAGVNSFQSLYAGFCPQIPALSFLPSRP